ncbi:hypothetical protein KRR40_44915 [Niabella defluvii]|nr:hypothetical protein KRR40_44915 [Niabella sp. I65]
MQEQELAKIQFRLLLNSTTEFVPVAQEITPAFIDVNDTAILTRHPALLYLRQQQATASAVTEAEKAKLLPDLILGYNSMSMKGNGADNKEYNNALRFHSVAGRAGYPHF